MATVSVRYIVDDVAVDFYTQHLSFGVDFRPAPGFAALARGDLRLLLTPLVDPVARLSRCEAGVAFRNGIVTGQGGPIGRGR